MTLTSFPVEGEDFTSAQWSSYLLGMDGVLAEAPNTFTLALSAVDDTCTVRKNTGTDGERSRVRVGGFVGEMESDTDLTLAPAVGSPVTYHVGFSFDPADYADPTGPITLVQFEGSFDDSGGKAYCALWDVTRSPSQTLNLATKDDQRRFVVHTINMNNTGALPPAERCLGFTEARMLDTGDVWQVQFTGASNAREWNRVSNPDGVAFPYTSPQLSGVAGESAPIYYLANSWVKAKGALKRATGTLSTGSDVHLGDFPAGSRPGTGQMGRFLVPMFTSTGWRYGVVRVEADGQVWLLASSIPTGTTVSQISLEGIEFRAEN